MWVAVDEHTGRMTAGTGQSAECYVINHRIIERLRNLIAILEENGYHSVVIWRGIIHATVTDIMIAQEALYKATWCKYIQRTIM